MSAELLTRTFSIWRPGLEYVSGQDEWMGTPSYLYGSGPLDLKYLATNTPTPFLQSSRTVVKCAYSRQPLLISGNVDLHWKSPPPPSCRCFDTRLTRSPNYCCGLHSQRGRKAGRLGRNGNSLNRRQWVYSCPSRIPNHCPLLPLRDSRAWPLGYQATNHLEISKPFVYRTETHDFPRRKYYPWSLCQTLPVFKIFHIHLPSDLTYSNTWWMPTQYYSKRR